MALPASLFSQKIEGNRIKHNVGNSQSPNCPCETGPLLTARPPRAPCLPEVPWFHLEMGAHLINQQSSKNSSELPQVS